MNIIIKKSKTICIVNSSFIGLSIVSALLLTSCSQVSHLLKLEDDSIEKDSALVVPPTLRLPNTQKQEGVKQATRTTTAITTAKKPRTEVLDSKDYYVVVGTYPNQDQALDTFVRLSSIGLPHATMESRKSKTGRVLHMVRLGPFHQQSVIDRVKDKLVNDGMSQFKVVIN
jgi:cell division protein FtsN